MMNFRKWCGLQLFLICIFTGIVVGTTFGQLPGSSDISAQNQQETTRLERFYEQKLKKALSNYYTKGSYLVDTKVELEEIQVPKEFKRSKETEEPVGLNQLPGLPILPEGFSRKVDEDTVKPDEFTTALQIRQKTVRVVVDTGYTDDDISFVEELVRSEADLDPVRGDIVTVDQRAFPRSKNNFSEARPKSDSFTELNTAPLDTSGSTDNADEAGFFSLNNPELLRYIIYALLAFVLLLSVALFLSARGSRRKEEERQVGTGTNQQAIDELKNEIQKLKGDESDEEEKEDKITQERRALFEKDRSYITNQYISRPQKVANLLEEWIQDDTEDGVLKAAKAVKGGNPKLLTTLRPVLKRDHFDALQYCIEDMDPMSLDEQMKQARRFRKTLQEASKEEEDDRTSHDMFNFLKQLSYEQILHLFKDESDDMIAIALAQLDGDRSADILQLLDEERRTSILIKMGNIDDLSIDAYKEVANHFSDKALKIINMKYVAADGVQSILQVIDTLPVDQQEEYVQSIAESDLELARKVREYFVGFSDIPEVEDKVLEDTLNELETETIILALIGADQEIFDKVMSFRPKREQQLIKSEIETRTDVDNSEIDEARKKLLQKIRNKNKKQSS